MFYRLRNRFLLRGWNKLPFALVDSVTGETEFLTGQEMEALELCCGTINTDLPIIDEKVRGLLPRLEQRGIIEPCRPGDRIQARQEYRLYDNRYIKIAHWSITGRCNYRCRHCYMSAPEAKYGELPHDTIMKMIDELAECGIFNVTLTGGEALVRPDFMEIVDALLDRGIRIRTIYSNGALVNESLLQRLSERNIHPEFNMSFDGVGWHDWLRGIKGAEQSVDRAFRLCRDMGFPTGVEMCIHRKNIGTLRESVLHLAEVGCRSLKTTPISNVGEWLKNNENNSVTTEEVFQCYLDYIPAYYEDGMPLSLLLGGFFSAGPKYPGEFDIPLYHLPGDPHSSCVCGHARLVMYISPEGRALPCMALSGMEVQNQFPLIPERGLKYCLSDSFYMNFIDSRADQVLEHNPECTDCPWRNWCLGGCRAGGLEYSGQKDLFCKDPATCLIFLGGWGAKLVRLMKDIQPEAESYVLRDRKLLELFEKQLQG